MVVSLQSNTLKYMGDKRVSKIYFGRICHWLSCYNKVGGLKVENFGLSG